MKFNTKLPNQIQIEFGYFFAHIGNFHLLDNIQDGALLSNGYCHV